jgi:outer membrane immunogenic protein
MTVGLVPGAHADSIPPDGTVQAHGPADWSGLYVGVQGGGAQANTGWFFPVDSYFTLPNGLRMFEADPHGGFMGGHITFNQQFDWLVVGVELALNAGSIEKTTIGPFTSLFPNDVFETRIDSFGTLVGRLGYARGDFLLYATGGYAQGRANFIATSAPPGGGVVGQVAQDLGGWTLGGGLEYLLFTNVVLGLQYDYIALEGTTKSVSTTGTPSNDPFVLHINDVEMHAVSLRLSLKLDQPETAP